jgi:ribonuclease E
MSEPGKDRWNSLLETLGVPADAPTSQPVSEAPASESAAPQQPVKQAVSMLRPEKKAAAKPKPTKPAAKAPSYWSRIAGALGLESTAEAEPAPEAAIEQPVIEPESAESIAESILPPDHFAPRGSEEPRSRDREENTARDREEFAPREGGRRSSRREERPARGEDRKPRSEERQPRREERPARGEARQPRREERDVPSSPIPPTSLNEMFGSKPADINVFGLGLDDNDSGRHDSGRHESGRDDLELNELDQPRVRSEKDQPLDDLETGPVLDYDQSEGSDLSFGEPRSGQPESGDEEGESRDGRRRRRRRRGRGRGRGIEQPQQSAPHDEADSEPVGEDADFDFDRDEELDLDVDVRNQPASGRDRTERSPQRNRDSESTGYPRGAERQPRRGERGRGEPARGEGVRSEGVRSEGVRSEGVRGEGGRGASRDDDSRGNRSRRERAPSPAGQTGYPRGDERGERRPPRDQRPPTGRGARPVDDELDDDLGAVDIEDDEVGESGLPTHSKIPTWDEAVNLLINANMATRANNPDRGGDRGRGRGGRGRGR